MKFEEQLLVGGLLMAIAIFTITHAHARPAAAQAQTTPVVATLPTQARL